MSITSIVSDASNYPVPVGQTISAEPTIVPSIESTPTPVGSPTKTTAKARGKGQKKNSHRRFKRVSSLKSLMKKVEDSDCALSSDTAVESPADSEASD